MTSPLGADPADLREVERIVRRAGTSFYRGMRILPPDRRAAMHAIYAFCRVVDDIADEPAPIATKRGELDRWRARIDGLDRGEADDPITRLLSAARRTFGLRCEDFQAVIDGMQTDAETPVVAPLLAELDRYCDQVASAVGRLSVRAFGDGSPAADQVAHHLGRALQLTNILRDLGEDAERGRLYLPREWLAEADIPPDPQAALSHPALATVCDRAARAARGHFRDAHAAIDRCDPRAMRPARLMAASYDAILSRLERRGWARPRERVSVPAWQKALILLRFTLARPARA